MKARPLLLALLLSAKVTLAQKAVNPTDTTTTVYGPLKTIRVYEGLFEWGPPYKINGREVDEAAFDHYHPPGQGIGDCTPCILETYGLDERILSKAVQFRDFPVGYRIEYFPNGKVKLIGHYRENDTGNWRQIHNRMFGKPDGFWTYFDVRGRRLYTETWNAGQFLRQVPEQKKPEVWAVQLLYEGKDANGQVFYPQQLKDLTLVPKFKNRTTTGVVITGKVRVRLTGPKPNNYLGVEKKFTLADFNKIDLEDMLSEVGVPAGRVASGDISIFVDGCHWQDYVLRIQF